MKAQLAYSDTLVVTQGHSENAASNGPRGIEIAGSRLRAESGARFVVSEAGEGCLFFLGFAENTGDRVSWELGHKPVHGRECPLPDMRGTDRVGGLQLRKSPPETLRIQLADGKDANAALRASRAAGNMVTTASSRIGEGCIDDLHELRISDDTHLFRIDDAARQEHS